MSDGAPTERLAHQIEIGLHRAGPLRLTDRNLYTDSRLPARGALRSSPSILGSILSIDF
jgi:hypothetical protein